MKKINNNLKVATVFSGIGAFEEALKQLDIPHEILFACDNGERYLKQSYENIMSATKGMTRDEREKYVDELYIKTKKENFVKQSYFANHNISEDRWHNDIRFLDGTKYKNKVDILVGGSPCQSFSIMGKRKGLEEARGTLFYDYARIIKEIEPKVFIFENVKGLLNHDNGQTWKIVSKIFDQLGYNWKLYVLNAKDYNLPQNRVRIFVVGYKAQFIEEFKKLDVPGPQHLTKFVEDYLEKTVENKYYLPQKGFIRAINPKEKKHVALNGKIARCQVACQQYNWFGDLRFESNIPQKILEDDRIFKGIYNGVLGVTRCLTPRECLRLMGFSDNFKQVVCDMQMYRQVGNSISVNVLKVIMESIIKSSIFDTPITKKQNMLKIATVFSGIGAPEFALKRLGIPYELIFACDNGEVPEKVDEDDIIEKLSTLTAPQAKKELLDAIPTPKKTNFVKKSFLANHNLEEEHFHRNVRFLDGSQYKGKVDLFVGGSPCQSFTLLGHQKGLEETRGTLFYDFARLIKEIEPQVFIYENVQGLIKHDKGATWAVVQRVFNSLGYTIHSKVLDAADYGLPQTRRRIFVVGFKSGGEKFEFPQPTTLKYTMQDFLMENTPEFAFYHDNTGALVVNKSNNNPVDEKYFLSEKILPGIMCAGTGGFHMKPEIDLPIARPLMSTMHKMHRAGEDNYVTTNGKIRRLTPRECLRLMGFTDDFKQVVSDTQMYKQAGNSMAVDVIMALIKNILKELKE